MNITNVLNLNYYKGIMSDLEVQPENDEIDILIEGTVKYLKTSRTQNQKVIQKFAVTDGRDVKVISYFREGEADYITVISFKPSHNMKYIFW